MGMNVIPHQEDSSTGKLVRQKSTGGTVHLAIAELDDQGNWVVPTLPFTYGNDGTNITSIAFTVGAYTWTQTLTYSGGILTNKSKWVRV